MAEALTAQNFDVNTSDIVDCARITLSIKAQALFRFAYLTMSKFLKIDIIFVLFCPCMLTTTN
jgi:hypothetical protein